jgi:ABC-2 type transport system permease protein
MKRLFAKYRYSIILLKELVKTDFKLRYQGSALGYLWSILRPLFLFAILYVVFAKFFKVGDAVPYYPVYLLSGIVLWNFFGEMTNMGIQSIVGRGDVIRKINFPKYIIVLSVAFSALINLFINLLVITVFMIILHVPISWTVLLAPLYILMIFAFALSVAMVLGAIYVRLRDIAYIWEIIMQALFYLVPVIYPLSMVSNQWEWLAKLMLLNPVAYAIQGFRDAVITSESIAMSDLTGNFLLSIAPIIITIGFAVFAVWFFKKKSPTFAEDI